MHTLSWAACFCTVGVVHAFGFASMYECICFWMLMQWLVYDCSYVVLLCIFRSACFASFYAVQLLWWHVVVVVIGLKYTVSLQPQGLWKLIVFAFTWFGRCSSPVFCFIVCGASWCCWHTLLLIASLVGFVVCGVATKDVVECVRRCFALSSVNFVVAFDLFLHSSIVVGGVGVAIVMALSCQHVVLHTLVLRL